MRYYSGNLFCASCLVGVGGLRYNDCSLFDGGVKMPFHGLNLRYLLSPDGKERNIHATRLEVYRALRSDTEMLLLWLREAYTTGEPFHYTIFSTYFSDVIFCLNCLELLEEKAARHEADRSPL